MCLTTCADLVSQVVDGYCRERSCTHTYFVVQIKDLLRCIQKNKRSLPTMNEQQQQQRCTDVETAASNDHDVRAAEGEIRQGLVKALNNIQLSATKMPPKIRDDLLEESFPKIHHAEGSKTIKQLTADEYGKLQISLQKIVRREVNEKMFLLREQLSEYHSVLEDVIAYKSRCERLEQEKKDLVSLCREGCQVRDDKIALLERELSRLKKNPGNSTNSSSSSSGSDWATSINSGGIGSGSGGHPAYGQHLKQSQTHPTPALHSTQTLPETNTCPRQSRTVIMSPASIQASQQVLKRDNTLNIGAIQAPPFQASSTPFMAFPHGNEHEGFGSEWWNRNTKKLKRNSSFL